MIVTLTVNPAIDRNVTVDRLVFEDRAYILSTHESAGGRGVNASCVIHAFGGKTLAIVSSGGKSGARIRSLLRSDCRFPMRVVRIRNEIRTNLTVTDKAGLTVKLNELGPRMDKAELARLEKVVVQSLTGASWIMICGSLPPGVPHEFYSRLVAAARKARVRVLLDADGEELRQGIEAGPTVVTPNQQEAERLLNKALITRNHFLDGADRIRRMGAESVILSLGSRGVVAARNNFILEVVPPRIDAVCPIGAGDAMAAAFVWSMDRGGDFTDAVRWAVAAGTASARLPGVTFASLEQAREIYGQVEIRPVSESLTL